MIELPEAMAFSKQINDTLKGKIIKSAIRGQNPHKFMFPMKSDQLGGEYSNEEFSFILQGKTITSSWSDGNIILITIHSGFILNFGCGGETILYHTHQKTLPKKHQLLIEFEDKTYLTVSISGWGEIRLFNENKLKEHPHIGYNRYNPLSDDFSFNAFQILLKTLSEKKKYSAKMFYITDPGLRGVGNGVIQDIFWSAKLNPKQEMKDLTETELKTLYTTTRQELQKMALLGGRSTEKNLFNRYGGYQVKMYNKTVGSPCPRCNTTIEKQTYLGGSIYFCPSCQPLD